MSKCTEISSVNHKLLIAYCEAWHFINDLHFLDCCGYRLFGQLWRYSTRQRELRDVALSEEATELVTKRTLNSAILHDDRQASIVVVEGKGHRGNVRYEFLDWHRKIATF